MGLFSRRKSSIQSPGQWKRRPAGLPKGFEKRQAQKKARGGLFARFMNPPKPSPVKEPKQEENPVESFFGKKKFVTRPEFRQKFRKGPRKFLGMRKPFSEKERVNLEQELFEKEEYGSLIDKKDVKKRLWKLKKEYYKAGTIKEKLEIKRRTDYLRQRIGMKKKK